MPCRDSTQWASGQTFYHRKSHLCDKNFLYKKLGRRRNVAPCKNCNQFFNVAPIICDFPLKVNPCAKFSRVFKSFQEIYFSLAQCLTYYFSCKLIICFYQIIVFKKALFLYHSFKEQIIQFFTSMEFYFWCHN